MIHINEGFVCENCGYNNIPAKSTCRNHCVNCLFSKHLDEKSPGDRKSLCRGIMEPLSIIKNSKKGYMIKHRCIKCKKEILNKVLDDDNFEEILKIVRNSV